MTADDSGLPAAAVNVALRDVGAGRYERRPGEAWRGPVQRGKVPHGAARCGGGAHPVVESLLPAPARLEGALRSSVVRVIGVHGLPWLRRGALGAIIGAMPLPALSAEFVLANPGVDPAWGQIPGQPIAPSVHREADDELPRDLTGQARTHAFTSSLLASEPTLDQAALFRFYSAPSTIHPPPDRPALPPETGPAAAGDAAAMADKARAAAPLLRAELDARFAKLTAALEGSESIVLPQATAPAVTYCRWIGQAAGFPMPDLATALWRHCIEDRDSFVAALVRRLADLAVIPDLPPPSGLRGPATNRWGELGSLQLVRSVLPGEQLAPLRFEPLDAAFQDRLKARFEAAGSRLRAELDEALARRAASDVVLPPAIDCRDLLGPYADPLAGLPASAQVAQGLGQACTTAVMRQIPITMERIRRTVVATFDAEAAHVRGGTVDDARIVRTPAAACARTLAPHFPAPVDHYDAGAFPLAGLDADQSAGLRRDCLTAARGVLSAAMDKHLAAAVAASRPEPDALEGWEASHWFPAAPGGTAWIDGREDPYAVSGYPAAFQAAYEAAMGPLRRAAAARGVAKIEQGFAVASGIEPAAATRACSAYYRQTVEDVLAIVFGPARDWEQSRRWVEAIAAKPSLSALEAASWVEATCRNGHAKTIERRVALAVATANVPGVFATGQRLAVRSKAGELREIDPVKLVKAAAVDGLQVAFVRTRGWLGVGEVRAMRVTAFAQAAPIIEGVLVDRTRGDQKIHLEVTGLKDLPGLDGPLETLECLALPVEEAYRGGQAARASAVALALFEDLPLTGGLLAEQARRDMVDAQACDAAKKAFRRQAAGD